MSVKKFLLLLTLTGILSSCNNDDGGLDPTVVPPETLSEAALDDHAEIEAFLKTHFYNYEEFANPPAEFDFKIRIDTISGDNSGKTPLFDQMESETIVVEDSDTEERVDHTLYTLVVRQGSVEGNPTIGDNAFVRFEGSLLDGANFDASTVPTVFNLAQVVRGFGNGVTKLRGGLGPMENGDGTVSYEGFGIGLVIMPSGLGYFGSPPQGSIIQQFTPLIFKVDLLSFEVDTDLDGDGIPSILEDLDGDGNLNNDNTDQDSEGAFFPNYVDPDDDGDGTLTIDEDLEPDTDLEVDRDGDGDKTNDIGDGNPLNDDTDGDGIPNYLDTDDTASRNDEN